MIKFPLLTMDYSPWSSKNLINRNRLKKIMQVGVDVTCMYINFGGRDLSSFGDTATLKNGLALGLYERCILKRTFRHTTGFCRFREEERRRLSRVDNFLQQLRSGVSRVRGEKVAAARTEKLGTHSLSHTHTHTHTHTRTHTHTHTHSLTHRTTAIPSLLAYGGEGNK